MNQIKRRSKIIIIIAISVIAYLVWKQIFGLIILGIAALMYTATEPTVITDLQMYQHVIGEQVDSEYSNKPSEYEIIFPDMIADLNVEEFQMVHYTSSDDQYLAYLTVKYGDEEYIDKNLLPDNFDATENNVYQEIYVEEMNETQDW